MSSMNRDRGTPASKGFRPPEFAAASVMVRRRSGTLLAVPAPVRCTRSRVCSAPAKGRCAAYGMTCDCYCSRV